MPKLRLMSLPSTTTPIAIRFHSVAQGIFLWTLPTSTNPSTNLDSVTQRMCVVAVPTVGRLGIVAVPTVGRLGIMAVSMVSFVPSPRACVVAFPTMGLSAGRLGIVSVPTVGSLGPNRMTACLCLTA